MEEDLVIVIGRRPYFLVISRQPQFFLEKEDNLNFFKWKTALTTLVNGIPQFLFVIEVEVFKWKITSYLFQI
jgi:hypothetical protein